MYDILVFQFLIVICLDFQSYCTLTRFCIGQADRRATASAYESIIEIRSIFDIWSLILFNIGDKNIFCIRKPNFEHWTFLSKVSNSENAENLRKKIIPLSNASICLN